MYQHKQFMMKSISSSNGSPTIQRYLNVDVDTTFKTATQFTQMSARRDFKQFGKLADAAIFKEFAQLDKGTVSGKPVSCKIDPGSITTNMKRAAL